MYVYDNKLVFIAHPRTASRATRDALVESGASQISGHHGIDYEKVEEVRKAGGSVVCTKRNMFGVLVSWYYHLYVNGKDQTKSPPFDEWLRQTAAGNVDSQNAKAVYLSLPVYHDGLSVSNRVLRFEHLQGDMNQLLISFGLKPTPLQRVGTSVGKLHYRAYYTPELRALVEDRWASDLQQTGYQW